MQLRTPLNLRAPMQQTAHKLRPTVLFNFAGASSVSSLITYTGSNGTLFNSSGTLTAATTNVPRLDYNPSTLVARGLLIEEARTNLFLNSLINGTNLSTQSVAVSATPYTLSFYGTGTITLSGASTAGPLTGSGAYPTRSTLTFTPSAGSLTCTVTGTVQYAQIEAGSFATSFIPTAGTTVTRTADVASITGASFSSFWNATQGTIVASYAVASDSSTSIFPGAVSVTDGTLNNRLSIYSRTIDDTNRGTIVTGGVVQGDLTIGSITYSTTQKAALAYKANDAAYVSNGLAVQTDTSVTLPTVDRMEIGVLANGTGWLNGWISSLAYYPTRLPDTQIQGLTVS